MKYEATEQELKELDFKEDNGDYYLSGFTNLKYCFEDGKWIWVLYDCEIFPESRSDIETLIRILSEKEYTS